MAFNGLFALVLLQWNGSMPSVLMVFFTFCRFGINVNDLLLSVNIKDRPPEKFIKGHDLFGFASVNSHKIKY